MRYLLRLTAVLMTALMIWSVPEPALSQKNRAKTTQSSQKKKKTANKAPARQTEAQPARPKAPQKRKTTRAEYEKQQKDLQKQIEATQRMISNNDQDVRAQSRDIQLREQEIGKRRALVVSMQQEIDAIREEEDSMQRTIIILHQNFRGKQKKYDQAIKHLYRWRSGYDELLFILSAEGVMEGYRRAQYLRQYSQWRKQQALQLSAEREKTKKAREALERTRQQRLRLMSSVSQEKTKLEAEQEKQNRSVDALKKKNRELQKVLDQDRRKQAEVQAQISRLIEEELRKEEEERKRQAELAARQKAAKARQGNTKSGSNETAQPVYTPRDASLTGSFMQNKGKMPYPVDSHYAIVQRYNAALGQTCMVLSVTPNAQACSIFQGTVTNCMRSSDDYLIIVSHGTYKSVYSNIQKPLVKEGQTVKTHQPLGVIKSHPDGKSGSLNFWLYKGRADVNPEPWLRK